jgi:hypothetical protein
MNEPITESTNARPYDGSSCSGLGNGSPTDCAPQEEQPLLKSPANLTPQQGQIVNKSFLDREENGLVCDVIRVC